MKASTTTRPPRRRRATTTTMDALRDIVGKLQAMSADAAATVAAPELSAWLQEDMQTQTGANVTDDDIIARRTKLLRLAQANRRVKGDPDQRDFYIIAWVCIAIAERAWPDDPATVALWAKIDAIKQREGLTEDECWPTGEGPADYQALNAQSDDRYDQIVITTMRMMGELEMAALYQNQRDEFDRRFEQGQAIVNPAAAEAMAGTYVLAKQPDKTESGNA